MAAGGFLDIVTDPEVFDFGAFNLFKVFHVYHLFDRQLSRFGAANKPIARPARLALRLRRAVSLCRGLAVVTRLRLANGRGKANLFYGASGRLSQIGEITYDLYNYRVVSALGRERFIIMDDLDDRAAKTYRPDLHLENFGLAARMAGLISKIVWRRRMQAFAGRVVTAYPELGFSTEEVIGILTTFCGHYLVNRLLISLLAPARAVLICQYGREAFIAACKRARLPVTELMHGSAVGANSFYHYPASYARLFDRALFPDRVGTFGEYWRQSLIRDSIFPEGSVVVAGYYLKVPSVARAAQRDHKSVVLVTTQPTVQRQLKAYVHFLKQRLDPSRWQLIIQPHPSENREIYRELAQDDFVVLSEKGTYENLAQCHVHVSVYSTVLFEAVRYGIANYVLWVPEVIDRCEDIVRTGVALPLLQDELPDPSRKPTAVPEFYLAEFNPAALCPSDEHGL
jgi:hypothetical protein